MGGTREERLTIAVLVAALLVGGGVLAYRTYLQPRLAARPPAPPPGLAQTPADPAANRTAGASARRILVHVAGAVRRPGLYELERGARARDAIAAAGGEAEDARLDGVNLAAVLSDGARVYVPAKPAERSAQRPPAESPLSRPPAESSLSRPHAESPPPHPRGEPAVPRPAPPRPPPSPPRPGPVDVNAATFEQLEAIPGIGPATAERLLRYRAERGRIRALEDLLSVTGIGPRRLEELRQYLFVAPASPPSAPAAAGARESAAGS